MAGYGLRREFRSATEGCVVVRILIVEDQQEMSALLADRLERSGYVVDSVASLGEAREALRGYEYPLVLLDRMLPDGDGLSILPEARTASPNIRVLLVTALRSINDKINGLDAGADDYLSKPFDTDELLARIRAALRRPGGQPMPPATLGELSFDFGRREALIRGEPFAISKREALLLESLMRSAGRAVKHETLMADIYGINENVQPDALKMSVSRLRQRLCESRSGVEIHTVRGVGYLLTSV
jgi:two-component system, OmpR family, response regulator